MSTPTGEATPKLAAQLAAGAFAGTWTLDPARSTVGLRSRSLWGLLPVKGVFREVEGAGTVTADGQVNGQLAVQTASVDTKIRKRDEHLRSGDFFASDTYPAIVFTLVQIEPGDGGVTVSGALAVRDQSRPLTFPATVTRGGDNEIRFDATLRVDRGEFGLTFNMMKNMASMHSMIAVHAVFTRA